MVQTEVELPTDRVLVDSSVWIDFFRGREAPHTAILKEWIIEGERVCLCGLILTEVLRGIADERQFQETRACLAVLEILPMTTPTFERATDLDRTLRKRGTPIRNTMDTLIAAVAIEHNVPLLHNDRDFDRILQVVPLQIFVGIKWR